MTAKIYRTAKEIDENKKGSEKKLKEHQDNIKNYGWDNNLNAKQTESYMKGWINALVWIMTK